MKTQTVTSVQEAIALGFNYVIAWRDHYRGNGKGEVYVANKKNAHIALSHFNMWDRGISCLQATNEDVIKMVKERRRILTLISIVKHSMTTYSKLYKGTDRRYNGHKMVFGNWRAIYKNVEIGPGAHNFNYSTFFNRHRKMLEFLEVKLRETDGISSTFSIIE